jgi:hypothetical protein
MGSQRNRRGAKVSDVSDSPDVTEPVVEPVPPAYEYVGPGYHLGVPARDLSAEDVAALEAVPLSELKMSTIYRVAQPDTDVIGRSDSDTVGPGLAVPPTDEPKGEAAADPGPAAGFVQADTSPGTTASEG